MLLLCFWVLAPTDTSQLVTILRSLNRFEVRFHQETYSDFMDNTAADGVLQIQRPGRLRMNYTRGERKEFICDGTTYYERDMLADTESRVSFDELRKEPLVRLLLFGDDPLTHFKIEARSATSGPYFFLKPLGDPHYTLEVRLDSKGYPLELKVFGEDGEGTTFSFSEWNTAPAFAPETFRVPPAADPQ